MELAPRAGVVGGPFVQWKAGKSNGTIAGGVEGTVEKTLRSIQKARATVISVRSTQ